MQQFYSRITGLFTFFLFIFTIPAATQDSTVKLTLSDAVRTAVGNNSAVKQSGFDTELSEKKEAGLRDFYLPRGGFSFSAVTTNNPLQAFGMKLQEKLITASDFNPDLLNHPGSTADFNTRFDWQQPLYYAPLASQRKSMAAYTDATKLIKGRTEESIAFETEKLYLQLQLVYASEKVLVQALHTIQSIYQTTDNYYKQGLVQRYDLLNTEVQIKNTETQLAKIRTTIGDLSDYLSLLMGVKPGVRYQTDPIDNSAIVQKEKSTVPDNRADFLATEKMIESTNWMIRSYKKSMLPQLNGFAAYQVNDNRLLGFGTGAYVAGLQLNWTISSGKNIKNQISQLETSKKQVTEKLAGMKNEADAALEIATRKMNVSEYTISQSDAARKQAAEALRVLQNRYSQGVAPTNDILLASTQVAREELNYQQALFDRQLAALEIRFLTLSH